MNLDYEWSAEIEAAAWAIAIVDGDPLSENAYSAIALPIGREAAYWFRAIAAISAYNYWRSAGEYS